MKIEILLYFLVILLIVGKSKSQISYDKFFANITSEKKIQLTQACLLSLQNANPLTILQMIDASSKIPAGIAKGNIISMGNYDECLAIIDDKIKTKFCKATLDIHFEIPQKQIGPPLKRINTEVVGIPQNSDFNVGIPVYICVPRTCSENDLNIIFLNLVKFNENQCLSEDTKPELDALAITAITIFAILGLIVVISTIYDIYVIWNKEDPIHPLTIAFSVYTNSKKLFHLGNSQQLLCLNGIKSLSMLWVVLGHVYMAYVFVPLDNYLDIYNWLDSARSQYISGAAVSVDTFLLIGGFLTVYAFQFSMDKGKKFKIPLYYFHRYLRLTPALAAMLLAHVALFNYFGSGPVWNNTDTYLVRGCKENWWSTLLYIQNYVNPNGICIPQSWYLSVDMQLFLISPLILVMMRQWPVWGYVTLSIFSVLSIVSSFLIGWFYKLNGQMTGNIQGNLTDFMEYYYMPTHTRMVPYLFGIMLGFAIYKLKISNKKPCINTILIILGWIVSLALMATCIYSGHYLQFTEYDRLGNSFFIALMRPAWSLALCWVIFACVMDHGGPINYFLSLPIFQILARISYSIYLVHYSFIFMTNFNTKSPLHFSEYNAFHKFWGDFAFTFVISILWTLIFESPVIVLEKVLLEGKQQTRHTKKTPLV